jgi:outer membrane beta-barrel protein
MREGPGMKTTTRKLTTRLLAAALACAAALTVTEHADAQEILLTGPLAGAPAVRKLRLHRQGRFELTPSATFTLLDEYQRTILLGAKLGYNFTDWLQLGVWGGYGAIHMSTYLTDQIQDQNALRRQRQITDTERRLTAVNLGPDFNDQLGSLDWIVSPQLSITPFRGKLALFQSVYLDTDLYVFGGVGIIGLQERADCTACVPADNGAFPMTSRTAFAPTFGPGLSFYINNWAALNLEWRMLPFSWNTGGFDTAGGGKDGEFPDNHISDADRRFHFQQMLSVGFVINLPTKARVSE